MSGNGKRPYLMLAAAILLSGGTGGCAREGDPESILADYLARVQTTAGVNVVDGERYRAQLLVYPDRRDRRRPLTDVRIGFLDFLALDDCGLQELVGQRNSSLGKVMPVSQQLVYEHRLVVGVRRCRGKLESLGSGHARLRAQLDEILEIKSADLPRAYWNATFGSPEFEHMFSLAASPMSPDAATESAAEIDHALRHLADIPGRLGHEGLTLEPSRLEAHYQALNSRRMAGETLRALDLLRFYLDASARAIETRLEAHPICIDRQPSAESRIFNDIYLKYYVGKVRPYVAKVHRHARIWLTAINRIARGQGEQMTPAFGAYFDLQISMDAKEALWPRYERALARHNDAWEGVMSQCGLAPATPDVS